MARRSPLVSQYLEGLSSTALENYQDIIKQYARGRHGIYALYRGNKLHYVGLAQNLPGRVGHHLKDRHRGLWNRFSMYLTIDDSHMRELEALLLRIVPTTGNRVKGQFAKAESLLPKLKRDVKARQDAERDAIFGITNRRVRRPSRTRVVHVRGRYKGKLYTGRLHPDGKLRWNGTLYSSPSAAASAVVNRAMNGLTFWHYLRAPGDWVQIKLMPKTGARRRRRATK